MIFEAPRTIGRMRALALLSASFMACSLVDDLDELTSVPLEGAAGSAADAGAAGSNPDGQGGAGGIGGGGNTNGGAGSDNAGGSGSGGSLAGSGSGGTAGDDGSNGGADAGSLGATRIFWLERGAKTVNVANTDGSERQAVITITTGNSSMTGIAVDPLGAKLYFTDDVRNRVQRANLDGSSLQSVIPGIDSPFGIDVDPSGGVFYVARGGLGPGVERANLDGSSLASLISSGLESPYGLAVYPAMGKLYVVDDSLDAVFSSDLDGGNLLNLNVPGVVDPLDISIDTLEDKLYWSERTGGGPKIRRANLDGSGVEDVVTSLNVPGFSTAAGLEVDVVGRALYFVDGGSGGSILRTNLDGSNPSPVVNSLNDPTGVTLLGR
jgi:DNA-binding beta-propeller fold protein YncE